MLNGLQAYIKDSKILVKVHNDRLVEDFLVRKLGVNRTQGYTKGSEPLVKADNILVLAMYALDHIDRGPQVRIWNLFQALRELAPTTMIAGERRERRYATLKYLWEGILDHVTGLYVENSTSWAITTDFALLLACRRKQIPVITYIRDAYPLFPETIIHQVPFHKRVVSSFLWRLSMVGYFRFSDRFAFQTQSFADLFQNLPASQKIVLGPAANVLSPLPISPDANAILYTGNASLPRFGVEMFVKAAEMARRGIPDLRILLVCPPDSLPPKALYQNRAWIEVSSQKFDDIPGLLSSTRVVVNPLRHAPYHHLQMPIKVMNYLSYGRPLLVTRCREIARFVEENQVGLAVDDTPESMAAGIRRLFSADLDELNQMGQNALQAVRERHSWQHRAQQILDTFEEIRQSR